MKRRPARAYGGQKKRTTNDVLCRLFKTGSSFLVALVQLMAASFHSASQQRRKPMKILIHIIYGYKGGIASLLLAVSDADMRSLYVNAGAAACVGDAGLFGRSRLMTDQSQY
jgi:hypothetical protein